MDDTQLDAMHVATDGSGRGRRVPLGGVAAGVVVVVLVGGGLLVLGRRHGDADPQPSQTLRASTAFVSGDAALQDQAGHLQVDVDSTVMALLDLLPKGQKGHSEVTVDRALPCGSG